VVDFEGDSGDLLSGWNSYFNASSTNFENDGIIVEGEDKKTQKYLRIINLCAPFSDRKYF
jgi:hypothetical protein